MTLARIEAKIRDAGLVMRGTLALAEADRVGALGAMRSLVLVGFAGQCGFDRFARSGEAGDGLPDPLDRWSRRVISTLAEELGGLAVYPFGGEPYWPFQRWAQQAEDLHQSPLGLLIHPQYGLWHSYRGALAFERILDAPPKGESPSPCETCIAKPCLNTCPVGAFTPGNYAIAACAQWLRSKPGNTCMEGGCLARNACPVGTQFRYGTDQIQSGMRAFLASRETS